MNGPFDKQNLVERLKSKGLHITEELVGVLAGETLDWAKESFEIHPNPYMKFAAPIVASVKPMVMGEIDKIDGVAGNLSV